MASLLEQEDKTEYIDDDKQKAIIEEITDDEELDAMEELIKEDLKNAEDGKESETDKKTGTSEKDKSKEIESETDKKPETSEEDKSKETETEPGKHPEKSDTSETSEDDNLIRLPAKDGEFVVDDEFISKQPEENRELFKTVKGKSKADLAKQAAHAIATKNPYLKDNEKAIEGIAEKILEGTDEEIYKTFIDTKRSVGVADPPPEKEKEEPEVKDEIPEDLPPLEESEAVKELVSKELIRKLKAKYPEMPEDMGSIEYREWKRDMVSDDDEKAADFNKDKDVFTDKIRKDLQTFSYLQSNHTNINNLRYNNELKIIKNQLDILGLTEKDLKMDLTLKPDNNGLLYNEELNGLMRIDDKNLDRYVVDTLGTLPFLKNQKDKSGMTPLAKKFFFENNLKIMALVANRNVQKDEKEIERLKDDNLNTLGKQKTGDLKNTLLSEDEIAKINDDDAIDNEMRKLRTLTKQ